ncbi:hypothetical protein Q4E93_20645 [Flavitalea sp. BT771]|uniref:hypothetical protein n=1 Tax=Flavitalea sp. BT771 TaxID=3063329 RepID=UPI0026E4317F|nr:hypothetical protein [Flavitalea sp. BT771]MDO6433029.1 hypothetical protein [Flavitalea sp. BT771]MDV6221695.1 hypothetical protein [Flavitalea sp. BT771]
MLSTGTHAFFRQVEEGDLAYFAHCIGVGAGLPYAKWEKILGSLELQFRDKENCWRPQAWVMAVEDRPVFLLEDTGDQVFLTGPPSWGGHTRRMALVWQAALVHFFLRLQRAEVRMVVQASRAAEVKALENLGCRRESVYTDRSGTHYFYVCRPEDLRAVI